MEVDGISKSKKTKRENIPQITVSKQILEGIGKGVLFKIFNPMMLGEYEKNRLQEVARFT